NESRREPVQCPRPVALSGITKPVVQTIGPTLPEFHYLWNNPIAAPMRRQIDDVVVSEAPLHFRETRIENPPGIDHFALVRNPGAELAPAGARLKIFFRLGARSSFHAPNDP